MTLPIQTYNRSLFKFGPLEKCNNGELMKTTDVLFYTRSMEKTLRESHTAEIDSLLDSRRWTEELFVQKANKAREWCIIMTGAAIASMVIAVTLTVKLWVL